MIRPRVQTLIFVALCALLLTQCSDNPVSPLEPVPPFRVSMEIDQHGGILALEREAWVIVPPGAVDSVLTFTITRKPSLPNLPANYRRSGNGYGFEPHGYTFNKPVRVSIASDPDLADPFIAKLDDENDRFWELLENATFSYTTASVDCSTLGLFAVVDFHALDSVFVSANSQGLNAAGTADDPLPSIRSAIEASLGAGEPYPEVFVAEGTYAENGLTLPGGVSVHGGYDQETWLPVDSIRSVVEVDSLPVYAASIAESTTVSGLEIRIGNATDWSANSVALHLVSCTSQLMFVRCRFVAGNGADGADGTVGGKGGNGGAGGNGAGEFPGDGGWWCHRGGRGGFGLHDASSAGSPGEGPKGGRGASGWIWDLNGGKGGDGGNGVNGGDGTSSGTGTAAGWEPSPGIAGANGTCGSGGGGGAGISEPILLEMDGGGGGGGGGGGYGGGGGKGGDGGGSSFAVYLYESSPVFNHCEFVSGDGGSGGNGGNGNFGGTGGAGGKGGSLNSLTGGRGGVGGKGGDGGGGQGGPGGHSYCVYRAGSVSLNATFILPYFAFGSPGAPGLGGFHGSDGTRAAAGAQGKSGELGP